MIRDTQGFTIIELLTVIVIIGILAVIGLPRFGSARDKAYTAQMQTDLRTLVSAQEAYFEETYAYATDPADLDFNLSGQVTIEILETGGNGWSARATHLSTTNKCALYIGPVTPPGDVKLPDQGIIGCTN